MKPILGLAVILASGLGWAAPAMAAPVSTVPAVQSHMSGVTDVSARRHYRVYRSYPRYRYAPRAYGYGYGPAYYPYYRPYYRPGFYIGTPFFGFGF